MSYAHRVRLTVVLATLNRVDFLSNCLASYLSLNCKKELVVIDGGSTDGSIELLSQYADHLISEEDESVYDAWNKGIKIATGDYIMFLNSDDELVPFGINQIFEDSNPQLEDVLFGDVIISKKNGSSTSTIQRRPKFSPREVISEPIFFNGYIFKKNIFSTIGNFDINFPHCSDQHFLWRCTNANLKVKHVKNIIYNYLDHADSLTFGANRTFFDEELNIAKSFNSLNATDLEKRILSDWIAWETFSILVKNRYIRMISRFFYWRTFGQSVYSIRRKFSQKFTSMKIYQ